MARNDQVTRILRIINMLETNPQGLTVREIHSRLEQTGVNCTVRSIYRDLEAIERVHLPITKDGVREDSRWKLDTVASVSRTIQFSYRELMALFIARNSMESMRGSPIFEPLDQLFSRLEMLLGPRAQEALQEFDQYLGFKARQTWQSGVPQEVLDTIHQACAEGHLLEIEYRAVSGDSKGEIKLRRVGPEAIYFADAGAYLIAKDLESGQHKTYALARVRSAVLLSDTYDSHGFIAKEFLRDGIGLLGSGEAQLVEIEIEEPMASYVSERRWHESQVVTRTENGIRLRMMVKVNDELVRWVLGLGVSSTVISPRSLNSLLIQAAQKIVIRQSEGLLFEDAIQKSVLISGRKQNTK